MKQDNDGLIQRKIDKGIFELHFKGRYFLMNAYPIRIIEIEEPLSGDELDDEVLQMLRSGSGNEQILQPPFSGFGAVEFISTTHCNLRCKHCTARDFDESGEATYYGFPAKHMSEDTMKAAIETGIIQLEKRLLDYPVRTPNFEMFITGGEPVMAWDQMRVALRFAHERLAKIPNSDGYVFTPHIVSNGTLIDENIAREMKNLGVQITIALDSPFNEVRVDSSGATATPDAVKGLKALVGVGHKQTSVNVVIAGEDMPLIDKVMDYLEGLGAFEGITTIQLSPLAPPIAHTSFADKGLSPKKTGFNCPEICDDFSDKLIEYSRKYRLDMKGYGTKVGNWLLQGGTPYRCPVAEWKWAVTPSGDVYACHQLVGIEQFKMGNISDPGWYDSAQAISIRERFKARTVDNTDLCPDCALVSTCMVFVDCPARSFLEVGSENRIVPHYCRCGKKYLESLLGQQILSLMDTGSIKKIDII